MIWLGNLARLVNIGHTQLHTEPKWLISGKTAHLRGDEHSELRCIQASNQPSRTGDRVVLENLLVVGVAAGKGLRRSY